MDQGGLAGVNISSSFTRKREKKRRNIFFFEKKPPPTRALREMIIKSLKLFGHHEDFWGKRMLTDSLEAISINSKSLTFEKIYNLFPKINISFHLLHEEEM